MAETWTLEKINQLISDQVQENLKLVYKSAGALEKEEKKKTEITKDVSAMANSDGGTIIYGIKEYDENDKRYLPEKIDAIDQSKITKAWLEHVINTIRPKIDGIIITPINADNEKLVIYIVYIPKGETAHQAQDFRYYKRFNFSATPMNDYEVRDVMGRNKNPKIELSFIFKYKARSGDKNYYSLKTTATNIGPVYAKYLIIYIEIPSSILMDADKKQNATYLWKIDNTIRDEIIEQPMRLLRTNHFADIRITDGPPRYVPILPGLSHEWEISLGDASKFMPNGCFPKEYKLLWKIYVDNALPIIGETALDDIKFQEPPHA
jgi:hypothetical protein